jgi:hypothetical protein
MVKSPVIVLCGRRTGSSMVANILQELGYNMGFEFSKASASSPRGHFEDLEWLRINAKALQELGMKWGTPEPVVGDPPEWFEDEVIDLADKRSAHSPAWGFKDPCTYALAGWYEKVLAQPYYLVVRRDQRSTAMSLERQQEVSPEEAKRLAAWQDAARDAFLQKIEPYRMYEVQYEHILEAPGLQVTYLSRWLGVDPRPEAARVVEPALANHGIFR